jgi:hypothetical protein
MSRTRTLIPCGTIFVIVLSVFTVFAQQGAVPIIQPLLAAHRAWHTPPATIQITGTSTRNAETEPIRITATQQEEALIEYRKTKWVIKPSGRFKDDGAKVTPPSVPSGFTQLDVTGLFFVAHFAEREVSVDPPERTTLFGAPARRVRMRTDRTEQHYGRFRVKDELDLYIGNGGLLAGIARSIYPEDPQFGYTVAHAFSDYREVNRVLLPYRIETYVKGTKVETIIVDSYEFDVPADARLFEPRRMP